MSKSKIIFIGYHEAFVEIFKKHLDHEFEVQMREGSITVEGMAVVDKLVSEHSVLQVDENISRIINDAVKVKKKDLFVFSRLGPVREELQALFSSTIQMLQKVAKTSRRRLDNRLCAEKSRTGPAIYNFTTTVIPQELIDFLQDGLNNVPEIAVDRAVVLSEIESNIKTACLNIFIASNGYYPRSFTLKDSMDTLIRNLIILEPSNKTMVSSLISLRENYVSRVPQIQENKVVGKSKMRKMQNLIPKESILSPSDKNLGISLLPSSWYEKEYLAQVEKGGYELQDINESDCVKMLLTKIGAFKKSLLPEQSSLLTSHWPKHGVETPRLGVLKLVPKVHKLIGPIDENSWKILKSRPIRGAECDPMKVPSKALYSLLQAMLSDFKMVFPVINSSNQSVLRHFF